MNLFIRLFTHLLTLARYIFLQSYISHSLALFLQLLNPFVCAFVCLFVTSINFLFTAFKTITDIVVASST